jgi:hypothetical protein
MAKRKSPSRRATKATIDGYCSLDIDVESAPHLEGYRLRCDLVFDAHGKTVEIVHLEPIVTKPFEARVGPLQLENQTTVRLKSSQRGDLSRDGHAAIPVLLHFDHSADVPFFEEDSDLALTLTTDAKGGKLLDAKGRVVLVGEGRFAGGVLDGERCHLRYEATVDPLPW